MSFNPENPNIEQRLFTAIKSIRENSQALKDLIDINTDYDSNSFSDDFSNKTTDDLDEGENNKYLQEHGNEYHNPEFDNYQNFSLRTEGVTRQFIESEFYLDIDIGDSLDLDFDATVGEGIKVTISMKDNGHDNTKHSEDYVTSDEVDLKVHTEIIESTDSFSDIETKIQDVHDAGGGSVVFPAGEWEDSGTIDLEGIENVVIKGQGRDVTKIISIDDIAIDIDSDCEVLEVSNCTISGEIYGLDNSGNNVKISNCTVSGYWDGLENSGDNIKVLNCTISGVYGKGLDNSGSSVKVSNCTISGKVRGIDNSGDNVTVSNCTVEGPSAGIYDSSDSTDIADASYYIANDVTGGITIEGNAIVADTSSPTYANLNRDELT